MAELSSNPVPFEIIEEAVEADRVGLELTAYSYSDPFTPLGIIPRRTNLRCLDEMDGPGGGSFRMFRADPKLSEIPNLLDYNNIFKVSLDGNIVGAFIKTSENSDYINQEERAGEYIESAGVGLRGWFHDAVVEPYRGIRRDSQATRVFSFASERGSWYKPSDWTTPKLIQKHSLDPNNGPFNTAPAEWPDAPNAYWIWGEDNGKNNPAPEGINYFRYEFDVTGVTGAANYSVFAAAKDHFQVYMDGQQIIDAREDDAYAKTWRADFELTNGPHVLAVRVLTKGKGAAAMIAALFQAGDATAGTEAQLIEVTNASGWVVNAYPDPAPGWTPGEIMNTLLAEATARGVRFPSYLTPTYTNTRDSDGVLWPRALDWSFDIGTEYYDVIEKLEELVCDVWIDPATYELHMYSERGVHRDTQSQAVEPVKFEIARNVTRAAATGTSEIKNSLLMQTEDGWSKIADGVSDSITKYGRREGYVSTGASNSVSGDLAQRIFGQKAKPLVSATYDIIDVDRARPFFDFFVGDWVLAPSERNEYLLDPRRVMSLAVSENEDTGQPIFAIEFDTIAQDLAQRFDRWLKTTSDGTLGGTLANVSGGGGGGGGTPTGQSIRSGPQGAAGARGLPGFNYRGIWDPVEEYQVSDVTYYSNRFWVAAAHTTEPPSTSADDWDELTVVPTTAPTASISLGRTTTFSLPAASTAIPWTLERFKSILEHVANSSVITIPDAGPYMILGEFKTTISSSGIRDFLIYVNGNQLTSVKTVRSSESATVGTAKIPGLIVPFNAGDIVEVRSTGNAAHTLEFSDNGTWLSILSTAGTAGPEGPQGNTGPAGTIASATAVPVAPGDTPTVSLGGTPTARTIEFGIPSGLRGEQGLSGTIESATATALGPGVPPSVTLGGTPSERTIEFGIPEGAQGTQGPPGAPLRFRGTWDSGTTYDQSDSVEYGGSVWVTAATNTNKEPGVDPEWVEISSGGGGGTGVPPGGLTGQVLTKLSDTDGDADWEDVTGPNKFETAGDLSGTQTGNNYTSVKWSIRPSTRVKLRALRLPATGYSAGTIQVYLDGGLVGSTVYGGSGSPSVSTDVVLDARSYEVEVRHSAGSKFTVTAASAPRTYWTSFCSLQVGGWVAFSGYLVMAQYDLEGAGDPLVPSRSFASVATASIAAGTQELTSISMSRGYRVIALKTDRPARVRIYATAAQQAADAARPVGTDPTGNHGLLLEYVTTSGMLEAVLSPMVDGASMEVTPSNNIPVTVTNLSGSAATVQVDLTYMRTE